MPIILIWNTEAAPFERQVKRWLKEMSQYGSLIGKWLGKRISEADGIERQTRAFPVVLFYNLSLTARIAPAQRGALLTDDPPDLGDSFARIGAQWNLPEEWNTRAAEARLLPRLMATLAQMTGAARGSVARLHGAPPSMFNPGALSAVDIIGLGSLAFRSIGSGRAGILAAGQQLHAAIQGSGSDVDAGAGTGEGTTRASLPVAMQLDNVLRYIAAGLLVIPALGPLLQGLGNDIVRLLKNTVIDQIVATERKVLDFRQAMLAAINAGLLTFSEAVVELMLIVRDQAIDFLRHSFLFVAEYTSGLTDGISVFFTQLRTFWAGIRQIIRNTLGFVRAIGDINLGPLLFNVFEMFEAVIDDVHYLFHGIFGPDKYEAPDNGRDVTVSDLVMNEGNGPWAHRNLQAGLDSLNAGLNAVGLRRVYYRIAQNELRDRGIDLDIEGLLEGVSELVPLLQQTPVHSGPLPPQLQLQDGPMPDIQTLFLDPAQQAMTDAVVNGGIAIQQGAENISVAIVDFLDSTAVTFEGAAENAARSGLRIDLAALHAASQEEVMANFPDSQLRTFSSDLHPLANTYRDWLVSAAPQAGMELTGAAVSGYLRFVLEEWDQHRAANADTPVMVTETSPRILLERAQVGRVHMRQMRIVATGRDTNRDLAQHLASQFRTAVSNAYTAGVERIEGFAAAAAAREAAVAGP